MKAALVIMAAGLGSRFGGVKQIAGIGPDNEILMEYSVHDAVRAGFSKVVFIIKPELTDSVKKLCGDNAAKLRTADGEPVEVCYAYQTFDSVPSFYKVPEDRTKPFGTVHAILSAREFVKEPFIAINADDYYGIGAFKTAYDKLMELPSDGEGMMVGYYLKNTVSKNGSVTRGVCSCENGLLKKVTETFNISCFPDGSIRDTHTDPDGIVLDPDSVVSMNLWGFAPSVFEHMGSYFDDFLRNIKEGDIKSECLLPAFVDMMITTGKMKVSVLSSPDTWFGMTYKEDLPTVIEALKALHDKGLYPPTLHV